MMSFSYVAALSSVVALRKHEHWYNSVCQSEPDLILKPRAYWGISLPLSLSLKLNKHTTRYNQDDILISGGSKEAVALI